MNEYFWKAVVAAAAIAFALVALFEPRQIIIEPAPVHVAPVNVEVPKPDVVVMPVQTVAIPLPRPRPKIIRRHRPKVGPPMQLQPPVTP